MKKPISGVVAVMLTPFTPQDTIDYAGLERLVEWYVANGCDALFAVCQSSEMQFLSLAERVELARFVVRQANGRVPVLASGHISDAPDRQLEELSAMAATGIDALVLVTNHLDPERQGSAAFHAMLARLLSALPSSLPLGLYECPAPYRRLLSDDELRTCADSGRFVVLKDVSCDLATVTRRVRQTAGTPLNIINANAAIAYPAMQAGSKGFCGVFANFHPHLYHWLYHHGHRQPDLADDLALFLSMAAATEAMGYPKNAKIYHQRLGTIGSAFCRANTDDVLAKHWSLSVLLDQIRSGTERYERKIAEAGGAADNVKRRTR